MRSQQLDLDGQRKKLTPLHSIRKGASHKESKQGTLNLGADQTGDGRHIFCPSGFLDDTWFHRQYWIFGRHFPGGAAGWPTAGNYTPAGRILACDEDRVYGYGRKIYAWGTPLAYHLYAAGQDLVKLPPGRKPAIPPLGNKGVKVPPITHEIDLKWSTDVDVHARALLVAGDTLFLAGPPAVVDEIRAYKC
jgi:hypothetical protein